MQFVLFLFVLPSQAYFSCWPETHGLTFTNLYKFYMVFAFAPDKRCQIHSSSFSALPVVHLCLDYAPKHHRKYCVSVLYLSFSVWINGNCEKCEVWPITILQLLLCCWYRSCNRYVYTVNLRQNRTKTLISQKIHIVKCLISLA